MDHPKEGEAIRTEEEVVRNQEEVKTKDEESRKLQYEVEKATAALMAASSTLHQHHVRKDEYERSDESTNNGECGKQGVELSTDDTINLLHPEERATQEIKLSIAQNASTERKFAERIFVKDSEQVHIGNKLEITQNFIGKCESSAIANCETDAEFFQTRKEVLMNLYKHKNAYMTSLLWNEKSRDFPIKEYFVDLRIEEANLLGKKPGESLHFTKIFPNTDDRHLTILVTGNPGYGKTSFCKKIAYDWSADSAGNGYSSRFDFVVCVTLRELGEKRVSDEVLESICKNASKDSAYKLKQSGFNLLIILDGFDEVFDTESILNFIREDSYEISKKITIIVTCRSHAAETVMQDAELRFSIRGFTPEQKEKYINSVIEDDKDKRNELLNFIKTNSFYSTLSECPLMLHLLCCFPKTKYFHKIKTQVDIFIQIFKLVIKRYMRKKGENHRLIKGRFFYGEDLLVKLGQLYYENEQEINYVLTPSIPLFEIHRLYRITEKKLKKIFPDENHYQFIIGLDIFAKCDEVDGITCFDFVHKSFIEFILCLYTYNLMKIQYVPVKFCNDLLILFGLYGNETFSDNFVRSINDSTYSDTFWLACANEIKNNSNKILFCSNAKIFYDFNIHTQSQVFQLQSFHVSEIYIHFSIFKRLFSENRDKLINLHKNCEYSNKLEISLFLDCSILPTCIPRLAFAPKINDFRQPVSMIANLINSYKWEKFKFYFCGIVSTHSFQYHIQDKKMYHIFQKIQIPAELPKEYKNHFRTLKENLVALYSEDQFVGEVVYVISSAQFLKLKDHIKVIPKMNN